MSQDFDKRIVAARPDLAAAHLKGSVSSARFAEGRLMQVAPGVTGLHSAPVETAGLQTQLLCGETFTIYEERNGWVWGQASLDSYVGYAKADAFIAPSSPTHRVVARSTPLLRKPDVKKGAQDMLPMNAKLTLAEQGERFARLTNDLYVFAAHVAPLAAQAPDWVSVAEQFLGVPYVWGGKTTAGLDCSGLVQTALEAGGLPAPRDTDMMEGALGESVPLDSELQRGDLIFWKGHVGVMLDARRLIHANGFAMQVSVEPLAEVRERTLASEKLPIRTIRRL